MVLRFSSPEALVEALHNRDERARTELQEWLGDPIRRLMQTLHARHRLTHRLDRLTRHALHAAETYLRTRPVSEFRSLSFSALRGNLLFQVARQVQPLGEQGSTGSIVPEPLPESEIYVCQAVFLPSEKIGASSFGGDWYGGRREEDGTLWLIVADITGHGYAAYLLAHALPAVWRKCWADNRLVGAQPGDVLAAMHDLLQDCLPEDVYAECTLLRLDTQGRATVAPAGGSRLLVRRQRQGRIELLKLRGLWLGFHPPLEQDQESFVLEAGDEVLLGTDGVFDQLIDYEGPGGDLTRLIEDSLHRGSLLDAVKDVLNRALRAGAQKDDITVVYVRRRLHAEVNGERKV
jgi:sigma-B regulation protein RsbU (phosphoserine phosphatase)